ncbi:hypothetical protein VNI00_006826 [Paramarasmius palmivorus]|uniref:F-box domain-containing protein n=1 Tax=Paramarasmius palmivorus TaxID=297713 RepID=A0AAW0D8V0_9AGAR
MSLSTPRFVPMDIDSVDPIPYANHHNPHNFLSLPDELKLQIFATLVEETQSAASLLAPLDTCRDFRRILRGEPRLWTLVCIDSTSPNLALDAISASNPVLAWPTLKRILDLSSNLRLSLRIHLTVDPFRLHSFCEGLTHSHIDSLISILLSDAISRCKEISVRCTAWEHLSYITSWLDNQGDFSELQSLTVQHVSVDNEHQKAHPSGNNVTLVPVQAPSELFDSPGELGAWAKTVIPKLTHLDLCSFPIDYPCFCAHSLTSLVIQHLPLHHEPFTSRDLGCVLAPNKHSLKTLHLGFGALPKLRPDNLTPLSLSSLTMLTVDFTEPVELKVIAEILDVPILSTLIIGNRVKDNSCPESNISSFSFSDEVRDTLAAYTAVMTHWPLGQVSRLAMHSPAFYEDAERNPISKLALSLQGLEKWDLRPFPLASVFFYRFTALQIFELYEPHESIVTALRHPPVSAFFPSLRSYFGFQF